MTQPDAPQRSTMGISNPSLNHDAIRNLIAVKVRFIAPMVVIYMVGYIGLTVLAGFAKGFMALKVIGSLNVGFVLIALNYILSWVLALIYVRIANTTFDPMVETAVARTKTSGGRS